MGYGWSGLVPPSAPINKECSHAVRERGVTACSWQDRQLAGRKGQLYRLLNPFSRGAPRNNLVHRSAIVLGRERESQVYLADPQYHFFLFLSAASSTVPRFCPPTFRSSHCFSDLPLLFSFVCSLRIDRQNISLSILSLSLSLDREEFVSRTTQQRNFVQQNRISWMGRGSRNRRAHEKIFFNCRKTIAGWMEDGHPRPRGSDFERFPIFLTRARRKGDAAGEIAREYIYIYSGKEGRRSWERLVRSFEPSNPFGIRLNFVVI